MLNIFYYNGTITNQGILKSYRNENRFRTIQFGNIWSFSSCSWNFLATGRILIWNSRTSAVNGKIADNTMLVIFISHRKPLQKHVFFEDLDRARFTVDIGHFKRGNEGLSPPVNVLWVIWRWRWKIYWIRINFRVPYQRIKQLPCYCAQTSKFRQTEQDNLKSPNSSKYFGVIDLHDLSISEVNPFRYVTHSLRNRARTCEIFGPNFPDYLCIVGFREAIRFAGPHPVIALAGRLTVRMTKKL